MEKSKEEIKANELAIMFTSPSDVFKPNILSIKKAIICCDEIINTLQALHKPEYITFYKDNLCDQMDGYEKKYFWQSVKEILEKK